MELTDFYQRKGGGLGRNTDYQGPGEPLGAESIKRRALKRLQRAFHLRRRKHRRRAGNIIRRKKQVEMMGFDFGSIINNVSEAVGSFAKGFDSPGTMQITSNGIQYIQPTPTLPPPAPPKPDLMKYLPIAIPVGFIVYKMIRS
jgi:hypothetical protein